MPAGWRRTSLNSSERELRVVEFELVEARAAEEGGGRKVSGYAALYNQKTTLADFENYDGKRFIFEEKIAPGAFTRALAEEQDVRLLFNHDPNLLLARTSSGTLALSENRKGLKVDADLPDTQLARDLTVLMERGDVTQMSFAFIVRDEERSEKEDDKEVRVMRTVKDVDLYDVSAVTYPAYDKTSISVRDAIEAYREAGPHVEVLRLRLEAAKRWVTT